MEFAGQRCEPGAGQLLGTLVICSQQTQGTEIIESDLGAAVVS